MCKRFVFFVETSRGSTYFKINTRIIRTENDENIHETMIFTYSLFRLQLLIDLSVSVDTILPS